MLLVDEGTGAVPGMQRPDRCFAARWLPGRSLLLCVPRLLSEPSLGAFRAKRYGQNWDLCCLSRRFRHYCLSYGLTALGKSLCGGVFDKWMNVVVGAAAGALRGRVWEAWHLRGTTFRRIPCVTQLSVAISTRSGLYFQSDGCTRPRHSHFVHSFSSRVTHAAIKSMPQWLCGGDRDWPSRQTACRRTPLWHSSSASNSHYAKCSFNTLSFFSCEPFLRISDSISVLARK